jgi:Icc-related predicted phosphoesterase
MIVVAISDTHQQHRWLNIPKCDVLIHSGDLTYNGSLDSIKDFNAWIGELKAEGVIREAIVIAGNHDWTFYNAPKPAAKLLTNAIYLEDSGCEIEGVKFYGSPWTPRYFDWAFMKDEPDMAVPWALIPDDTNVLITHGPPRGVLDRVDRDGSEVGCVYLRKRIAQLKLDFHIFGHIHEGYGERVIDGTTFLNAASVDLNYNITNEPIKFVVEAPAKQAEG